MHDVTKEKRVHLSNQKPHAPIPSSSLLQIITLRFRRVDSHLPTVRQTERTRPILDGRQPVRRLRNVTRHAYALEFVSRVATSGLRKNARNRGNGLSLAGGFVGPPLLIGDRPVARLKPVRFCLLYVVDSTVVTTFCLPALFELSAEVARVRVELRGGDGRGHCLGAMSSTLFSQAASVASEEADTRDTTGLPVYSFCLNLILRCVQSRKH